MNRDHPIVGALVEAILSQTTGELDEYIHRAASFVGRTVIIRRAIKVELDYENTALILLEDAIKGPEELLMISGNAGRQALFLDRDNQLPTVRTLRKLDTGMYFWDDYGL